MGRSVTERVCVWSLAAHCLKANEHVRLVERSVCFISDAGNWGRVGEGGRHLSKGRLAPDKQGVSAFIDRVGEGGYMQKQHCHL